MLTLIFAFGVAALAHRYLQMYAPSNAIVARVRRERPRIRVAARLVTLSCTFVLTAMALDHWAATGGPGWLHLVVIVALWDAFKFAFLAGLVSLRACLACSPKPSLAVGCAVQDRGRC